MKAQKQNGTCTSGLESASFDYANLSHLCQQAFKLLQVQRGPTVGGTAVGGAAQPIDGD